jgi:hypothetical protein
MLDIDELLYARSSPALPSPSQGAPRWAMPVTAIFMTILAV